MFDAKGIFHDGTTITADISATSLTRADGSAVLDLKETPATGLSVVALFKADIVGAADTVILHVQECATVDGTYVTIASFPLLTKGTGMPGTYIRRFASDKRYIRVHIDITDAGGGFSLPTLYVYLATHPFHVL